MCLPDGEILYAVATRRYFRLLRDAALVLERSAARSAARLPRQTRAGDAVAWPRNLRGQRRISRRHRCAEATTGLGVPMLAPEGAQRFRRLRRRRHDSSRRRLSGRGLAAEAAAKAASRWRRLIPKLSMATKVAVPQARQSFEVGEGGARPMGKVSPARARTTAWIPVVRMAHAPRLCGSTNRRRGSMKSRLARRMRWIGRHGGLVRNRLRRTRLRHLFQRREALRRGRQLWS
mmetsp:Transcript_118505/g.335176  ORF Transcript_118505/g.335176 Transcript_118505/m.335176 type:complete len:233 (-) Transcript_118505:1429-2127(-)